MIPRERLIDTARRVYRSYGFSPIDTPALEYLEILTGKGGDETDKQLYQFEDHGGREVGMRFDLTVPLARFAAQHVGELGMPFKRYHIATVWRGENTQRGRYREFMQCDFDTIGTRSRRRRHRNGPGDSRPVRRASASSDFTIRVNNRLVLTGLLEKLGLADKIDADPAGARQARPRSAARKSPTRWSTRRRDGRAGRPRCSSWPSLSGTNDEMLAQLEPLVAGSDTGRGRRRASCAESVGGRDGRRRAATQRLQLDVVDRPRPRLLHRHDLRDVSRRPAGDRQRLLRRPLRQSGRRCSPSRSCPASARRWASTGCWRRWKSWG